MVWGGSECIFLCDGTKYKTLYCDGVGKSGHKLSHHFTQVRGIPKSYDSVFKVAPELT